ncbi:hypothetical protein SNE510_68760 [Streptomyces sp. NE5-10]|nr:hypothetical protein SNE510_68760 [Streptomyces sp. NE5-10]
MRSRSAAGAVLAAGPVPVPVPVSVTAVASMAVVSPCPAAETILWRGTDTGIGSGFLPSPEGAPGAGWRPARPGP